MPIRVRETAEALSEQSQVSRAESTLNYAPSVAGRILRHELERYCSGQINGRSFLIAGHRGAGKTTMVSTAIDRIQRKAKFEPQAALLRPLPVFLHGPSLFETDGTNGGAVPVQTAALAAAEAAPTPAPAPAQPAGEAAALARQAQVALTQVILGLHRAVVKEFVQSFHARSLGSDGRGPWPQPTRDDERLELAAQFEIEVLEDPTAARLKDFWHQAGCLGTGVLFEYTQVRDQGLRELVALNGMCNAHQRISGDISAKQQEGKGASTEQKSDTGVEFKGAELIRPVVAVLAGTAVATGGAVSSGNLEASALVGLLTALVSSAFFKSSSSAVEKRSRQVDTTFIPDLSHKTLDRVLPTLIHRLRQAGLAPVLIVDELDKVRGLPAKLEGMIHFLKKLVAEDGFTCFLTDRGYIEHLRLSGQGAAYGLAYSYFSHPLLINFTPDDFDQYLRALLVLEPLSSPPVATSSAASMTLDTSDSLDLQVLPWVLRHRSRLHALALAREVAAIRGDDGLVSLRPGVVRSETLYRADVTFQVAIELRLKSADVGGWQKQRPDMLQALNDALYFLSREWVEGAGELVLDGAGRERFRTKLRERMNLEEVAAPDSMGALMQRRAQMAREATASPALSDDDFDLLLGVLEGIVQFLSETNNKALADRAWSEASQAQGLPHEGWNLPQAVLDALLLGDDSLLYSFPTGSTERFRWRYSPSGKVRQTQDMGEAARAVPPIDEALAAAAEIGAVEQRLTRLLRGATEPGTSLPVFEWLADWLRILETSPAWASVSKALANLELARKGQGNRSSLAEDCRLAVRFRDLLRQSEPVIAAVVLAAAFLAGAREERDALEADAEAIVALRRALELLSVGLRFSAHGLKGVEKSLGRFVDELGAIAKSHGLAGPPGKGNEALRSIDDAEAAVPSCRSAGHALATALSWDEVARGAWADLQGRATALFYSGQGMVASARELLCAMRETGPARHVPLDLSAVSLLKWTSMLIQSRRPQSTPGAAGATPPMWLLAFALRQLGAGSLDPASLSQVRRWALGATPIAASPESTLIDGFLAGHGNSSRVGILLVRGQGSPAERWQKPPDGGGLLLVVEERLCNAVQSMLRETSPGLPVLLAAEQPSGLEPAQLDAAAAALRPGGNSSEAWLHVYATNQPSMRRPNLVDPQSPDDVLAFFGHPLP